MKKIIQAAFLLAIATFAHTSNGKGEITTLPPQVKSAPGEVSLFADFSNRAKNGTVPVYLINGKGTPLQLAAQDGDIYLKLEAQNEDGKWVRVQPHRYSWCGNSYFSPPAVPAKHFHLVRGYQPTKGKESKVRYTLYGQTFKVSSNVGTGLVCPKAAKLASRDAMSVREGDFDFVSKVALGEIAPKNEMAQLRGLQMEAIHALGSGRFDAVRSNEVLAQVIKKCPHQKGRAINAQSRLKKLAAKSD